MIHQHKYFCYDTDDVQLPSSIGLDCALRKEYGPHERNSNKVNEKSIVYLFAINVYKIILMLTCYYVMISASGQYSCPRTNT